MPRIPRDLSGRELSKKLEQCGYEIVRQSGSHIRLCAQHPTGTHKLTIPDHNTIKIGTLNSIIASVADALETTKVEIVRQLFSK